MTEAFGTEIPMRQSALRLPADLYGRLREAGGDRGMGEEIRKRLQASFDAKVETTTDDPKTRQLLETLIDYAENSGLIDDDMDVNPWHGDPYVWAALKTGVNEILDFFKPKELMPAPLGVSKKFTWRDVPAESVGRNMARQVLHRRGLLKKGE
jgi:hypothetical protein